MGTKHEHDSDRVVLSQTTLGKELLIESSGNLVMSDEHQQKMQIADTTINFNGTNHIYVHAESILIYTGKLSFSTDVLRLESHESTAIHAKASFTVESADALLISASDEIVFTAPGVFLFAD